MNNAIEATPDVVAVDRAAGRKPSWEWLVIGVFVFSSTLNYLDRQLLAALAATIRGEFHLTSTQYGTILSVFSIVYLISTPLAGLYIDRVGLNRGVTVAVVVWSLAGAATGMVQSFFGLLVCRGVLGLSQSAGIPSAGKTIAQYLPTRELALGRALNTMGTNLGSIAAPLVVATLAPRIGWRAVFIGCGALGLFWVPLWFVTSRSVPARPKASSSIALPLRDVLRDRRLWGLALVTALVMSLHTLWTNWTTLYFVHVHHLSEVDANRHFAWIPPVFGTLGALFGGYLSFRLIGSGTEALAARLCVRWLAGPGLLVAAAVPFMQSAPWAAAAISVSLFASVAISTNLNVIPIDLYGPRHAAFGAAVLTCSYGLMQALLSPAIGAVVDQFGFTGVCIGVATMAFVGACLLGVCLK